jgi:hypothetical protein
MVIGSTEITQDLATRTTAVECVIVAFGIEVWHWVWNWDPWKAVRCISCLHFHKLKFVAGRIRSKDMKKWFRGLRVAIKKRKRVHVQCGHE